MTSSVINQLQRQLPSSPGLTSQLMLTTPMSNVQSVVSFLWTPNICRSAEQYRGNQKSLRQVAIPVVGSSYGEWQCSSCKKRMSKISAPLSGTVADQIWIGIEGMFKAHGPDGWSCIWRRVHKSCFAKPFASEWELLKHMKEHHTVAQADTSLTLQAPADIRVDCFGIGGTLSGKELEAKDFVH